MPRSVNLRQYLGTLVLIWSAGIAVSLGWNLFELNRSIVNVARTSAMIAFEKDLVYRRWAAGHGGVYVPITETTPPNPYLMVPERDLMTTDGLALTLINPAYMTRQANELAMSLNSFHGHITSLNPIRPGNAPDIWEKESLLSFERGVKEVGSIETISGKESYRFMRPFTTEKPCLKCHEQQGYKEEDIRRHQRLDPHGTSAGDRTIP